MRRSIQTAWLINPPGPLYQRGEDRCQANIEASSAVSLRAPNDLAYMAAVLRLNGVTPQITDYPAEGGTWKEFEEDLKARMPDLLIMSITNATIMDDMKAFAIAKQIRSDIVTVAKGALFHSAALNLLEKPEFEVMDFALVGESETVVDELVIALRNATDLASVAGVICRGSSGSWIRNPYHEFDRDLDAMPFPARDLLRNELYVRPDTGEAQATIQTARGCSSQCIFCLTPAISGERVRSRSVSNIVDELEECVTRFGIRNFFFKADTFTINKNFVIALCREIIDRKLNIAWVANSRVDTMDAERLDWMKRAGCWLVAFGFESGNDEILKKMKKGATVADAYRAAQLTQQAGMKVYGFFMIGLPWDNEDTIRETISLAKQLACDFYEIHIATPYEGTELHSMAVELGLLREEVAGHDYFNDPVMGSLYLSREEILDRRRKGLRSLYLSPRYVGKTLAGAESPAQLLNYARYGARLLKNLLVPS